MLLVGIPLVSGVIGLLLVVPLIALDTLLGANPFTSSSAPFLVVHPILLAIVYLRVRRMRRTMLSLVWAYAIVATVIDSVVPLLDSMSLIDESGQLNEPMYWLVIAVKTLVPIIVLVWFARQASRISFQHALVLIGLSTALVSSGVIFPHPLVIRWGGGWPFTLGITVFTIAVKLLAFWVLTRLDYADGSDVPVIKRSVPLNASILSSLMNFISTRVLPRFDPARGRYTEAIIALLGLSCLLRIGSDLRPWVGEVQELTPLIGTFTFWFAFWAALTIGLTYVVRVRQPPNFQRQPNRRQPLERCPKHGFSEESTFPATRGAETTFAEDIRVDQPPILG